MHFTGTKSSPFSSIQISQKLEVCYMAKTILIKSLLTYLLTYLLTNLLALDSAAVEFQEMFSSHGGQPTNAIKLTNHDETRKRAHDSQIVRAKENLKLSHSGSSYR